MRRFFSTLFLKETQVIYKNSDKEIINDRLKNAVELYKQIRNSIEEFKAYDLENKLGEIFNDLYSGMNILTELYGYVQQKVYNSLNTPTE